MKTHIVVVNSFGPMGAALMQSLLEKWGFSNHIIRKTGLSDYLLQEREITDFFLKKRFRTLFEEFGKPGKHGGVSRTEAGPLMSVIDLDKAQLKLRELEDKKFENAGQLFKEYLTLFGSVLTYKKDQAVPGCHAELFVESHRFSAESFEAVFSKFFDEVTIFHMHRNLEEWLEALGSQYMISPERRLGYRLGQAIEEYEQYSAFIHTAAGSIVDLDFLTTASALDLNQLVSDRLGNKLEGVHLENEVFDVATSQLSFRKAFTKSDTKGKYWSFVTRFAVSCLRRRYFSKKWRNVLFHPFYLFEIFRFYLTTIFGVLKNKFFRSVDLET